MQPQEPSWKVRSRPCPFYSQGKCLFSKNCSFLHDVKSTLTVIRVTAPDDDDGDGGISLASYTGATASAQQATLSNPSQALSDTVVPHVEIKDSYSDEDSPDEEDSDLDSPTIRKLILPRSAIDRDTMISETGPSRDSVATVKGDSHSPDTTSRSHSSLPKFYARPRRESSTSSSHFSPTGSRQGSVTEIHLLPPFTESPVGSVSTPTSATSATAQELEVPTHPNMSNFSLENAASSSLLANRLARSRQNPPSVPSIPDEANCEDLTTRFSAGAFYASYDDEDDAVPASSFVGAMPEMTSPKPVSSTSQTGTKTPNWLRPLRLASALTPQTEPQSSASLNSISRQFTHKSSTSSSPSSMSNHSSLSSAPLYDIPVTRESPELYRRSSSSSNNMVANTPHTIVLSDYSGYMSPLALSRNGSIDIDMSQFPPPPASPESDTHRSTSSQASNSLSELIGRSPRKRPVVSPMQTTASQDSVGNSQVGSVSPRQKATTSAEQFRSALERRAKRIKESSRLISPSELQNGIPDPSATVDSQNPGHDSTPSSDVSWSSIPRVSMQPHSDAISMTSFSNSLLMQQVQSSPPRRSPRPRASPSTLSTTSSPAHDAAQLKYTRSPDPSPRPHLLFAIASDQPAEVERLLSSGEASANETTGTGTGLLEFTVANEGLKNKTEMVKTLLKYGADPGPLAVMAARDRVGHDDADVNQSPALAKVEEAMNPAMKYYLTRPKSLDVDSKPALEALQNSSFAPLARARFDIIGQDRALDEFYRVLGMHSQRKGRNALVILLCGASGHGKSLLAQKVGSLLDVPTHTINMTALRSQHDLWQCLSTGIDDASPDLDLSEFLVENQGKRCVVVLDEIEKVDDSKSLNPLLLPWDIGRCSLEQKKHTDTSQVIWIATSNLGRQIIAEHVAEWGHPDLPPTRAEYTQLATAVRRRIADILGASLLSRVTAILPFLPFTEVEKIAIGTEAAISHTGFLSAPLSSAEIEAMVRHAVKDVNFVEEEGARSLQRVVETHLSMRT